MNELIFIVTLILFGLILWLLYQLQQTANQLSNRQYKHDSLNVFYLLILLSVIILAVPIVFTFPIFNIYKSETGSTGEIGDTIGGLTAPFINGIGAILVYLAFKEQVKSTQQTRNLEIFKIINDRLNWLKTDPYNIANLHAQISAQFTQGGIHEPALNKATYLLIEFDEVYKLCATSSEENENLQRQTQYLYRIVYRDHFINLHAQSYTFVQENITPVPPGIIVVADFMMTFEPTDRLLGI